MELFSSEAHSCYSDEEQVYMVQGLLNLQIKNFRSMLQQVANSIPSGRAEARRSKLQSLLTRLALSEADINSSF